LYAFQPSALSVKIGSLLEVYAAPLAAIPTDTIMLRRNVTAVTDWRVLHKIMISIDFYSYGRPDVVSQMRKEPVNWVRPLLAHCGHEGPLPLRPLLRV
jgi:hypothetical protein